MLEKPAVIGLLTALPAQERLFASERMAEHWKPKSNVLRFLPTDWSPDAFCSLLGRVGQTVLGSTLMGRRIALRRRSRRKCRGMLQHKPAKRCKIAHQDVGGSRRTGNQKRRRRSNVVVDDGVT